MNAIELGNQLEPQYEGNEDYNGYLDKGQTVIDFLTREHNCSLQEVLDNDPARVLKLWIKCYKQAHLGALLGTAIGAIGFMGGMAIGALPLSGIGAAAAVYSFLTARHHKDAIEFAEHEEMILNQLPGLLFFMADKERAGARTSALASKYNYMILECFANSNIDLRDPAYLKGFLEGDVQRDQIFNQYSPFPSITPAIDPAPSPKKAIGPTTRLNAVEANATRVLDDGSIPSWQPAVPTSVVPQDEVLREDYWGKGDEMGDLIDRAMAQAQQSLLAKSEIAPNYPQVSPNMTDDYAFMGGASAEVEIDDLPLFEGEEEKPFTAPANPQELMELLKKDCPALLKLMKAPPIRLVGHQRTGKSTFARKLALLRMILLEGHRTAWSTPHAEADNPVPKILMPFGYDPNRGKDYLKIQAMWKWAQENIDKGKHLHLSVIWDEFGGYGDGFQTLYLQDGMDTKQSAEETQKVLGLGLRSILREATKHDYHPIFVAHGDQAAFYPGVPGLLGTLKGGTIKIETIGRQIDDLGKMSPTGEAVITWMDGTVTNICLPPWLTDELLLSLAPQPKAKAA